MHHVRLFYGYAPRARFRKKGANARPLEIYKNALFENINSRCVIVEKVFYLYINKERKHVNNETTILKSVSIDILRRSPMYTVHLQYLYYSIEVYVIV